MYEEYIAEEKKRLDEQITLAWYIAKLTRAKEIPDIRELLKDEVKQQTPEEMLMAIKTWNALLGGKIIENNS